MSQNLVLDESIENSQGLMYFGHICLKAPAFVGVVSFLCQLKYDIHPFYEISPKTDAHKSLVI